MAIAELRNATNTALRRSDSVGDANFADIPQVIAPRTTARWEVYGAGTSTFVLDGIDDIMAPRVTIGWVTTHFGTRFFAHQVGKQLRVRQGQPPYDGLFTIVMARTNTMPAVIITPTPPPETPRPAPSAQITTTNATIAPARRSHLGLPRHLGLLIPTLVVAVAAIVLSGTVTATNIRPGQAVVATVTPTATTVPTATTAPATQPAAASTSTILAPTVIQKPQAALVPAATPTPAKSPQAPPAATSTTAPSATPVPATATPVPPTPTATTVPATATPVPPGNLALNFTQAFASCVSGFFIQVTATNTGGQSLTWSATATVTGGKPFASASPASGTIAAGQRAYIGINGQGAATAVLLTITWTSAGQSHTSQVTYTCG